MKRRPTFTTAAAIAFSDDSRTVERPSPGKAPTAFRVWAFGANVTDHGTHYFTEESARKLMAAQAARGNLFSIDVDHLSLSQDAPPESRKAVGWNRLEVRKDENGNPEMWLSNVAWTAAVKPGIEADPPEWRYFSPAYDHDEAGEITRYLNTALTNNPATWRVTALATSVSTKGSEIMTIEEILAALQALADAGDEEAKRMLEACKPAPAPAPAAEATTEEKPPAPAAAATRATEEEKPAGAMATILAAIQGLSSKVEKLEADKEASQRTALLATRPDLSKEVHTVLAKMPMALLKDAVALIPRATVNPAAAAQPDVMATVGAGQGDDRAPALPPAEAAEMRAQMGLAPKKTEITLERGKLVLASMNPAQATAFLASRRAKDATTNAAAPVAGKTADK